MEIAIQYREACDVASVIKMKTEREREKERQGDRNIDVWVF